MKRFLSRFIPLHFTTTYGVEYSGSQFPETARWWQWRDHIFRHTVSE